MIWIGIYLLGLLLVSVLLKDIPHNTGPEAAAKLVLVLFWPIALIFAYLTK